MTGVCGREQFPLSQRGRRHSDRRRGAARGLSSKLGKFYLSASYLNWCWLLPLAFVSRKTTPAPKAPPPLTKGELFRSFIKRDFRR